MTKYIQQADEDSLRFVIAGYNNNMVYHEYDSPNDTLCAGKNLTEETAKALFKFVTAKVVKSKIVDGNYCFRGIIPNNIIKAVTDKKVIIWWTPGHMQEMFFKTQAQIKDGLYWVPDMLWYLKGDSLNVFALKGKPKSEKDKLYMPPFFNVSANGSVCMGNAKFKSESVYYDDIIAKVEKAFWNSKFTHSSNNKMLNTNYTEYMKEIYNVNFNSIMIKQYKELLIEQKQTINDILK